MSCGEYNLKIIQIQAVQSAIVPVVVFGLANDGSVWKQNSGKWYLVCDKDEFVED